MRIPIDRQSPTPLYLQISSFIREQIENRSLAANSRLPATRNLAATLGIGRLTVSNAYAELESTGLIYGQPGDGTFVAPITAAGHTRPRESIQTLPEWQQFLFLFNWVSASQRQEILIQSAAHPDLISFAEGSGDPNLFPIEEFRKSLQNVLRTYGDDALGYGDPAGYFPLRRTIAQILSSQGIPSHPDQVMIISGSQQGLHLVVSLLVKPGESVVVESPTHMGFIDICQSSGIKMIEIPVDDQGMAVENLEGILQKQMVKLIYSVPNFQNPSGACLSSSRRRQLVLLAEKYNVPILEDDYVGDLRYKGTAQPALKALDHKNNVIYVSTFSKMLIPSLRVGYLTASGPVFQRLLSMKHSQDVTTSNLIQHALETYISLGRYQACQRKARQVFGRRRSSMLAVLTRFMPEGTTWKTPMGGFFIWLKLPNGLSADGLFPYAAARHVAFTPGSLFFSPGKGHDYLRLNFSLQPPERLEEGIRRLAAAIRDFRSSETSNQ